MINNKKKHFPKRSRCICLRKDVTAIINEAHTIPDALQSALKLITTSFDWRIGHIFWVESGSGMKLISSPIWYLANPEQYAAFQEATMKVEFSIGEGLPGRVLLSHQAEWAENQLPDNKRRTKRNTSFVESGLKVGYASPILVGNSIIGVLEFFSERPERPNRHTLKTLSQIGIEFGQMIQRLGGMENVQMGESHLAEAQLLAKIGSWSWDLKTDRVSWSDQLYRIYGMEPGEFSANYSGFLEHVHPDDREEVEKVVKQTVQDQGAYELYHRIIQHNTQSIRYIHARGRVIVDANGQSIRMIGTSQDITEQKQIEAELQNRKGMFEDLFESVSDGLLLIDNSGKIIQPNRQAELLFGYTREEFLEKKLEELITNETELFGIRKDGSRFHVDIDLIPTYKTDKPQMLCTVHDVTQWRQAQEQLLAQDKLLRMVVTGAPLIIWSIDKQGSLTLLAGKGLLPLGVREDQVSQFLGKPIDEYLPKISQNREYIKRALKGEEITAETRTPDGLVYESHFAPLINERQEITGVAGLAFDVTRRVQTEEQLRASEEKYRLVIEGVKNYAIFTLDVDGLITSWNVGGEKILGYTAVEVVGEHFSIFYPEHEIVQGIPEKALAHAVAEGRYELESVHIRKDGTHIWVNVAITPLYTELGKLRGFSKVVRDRTEHKRLEEELRNSEERFRTVFMGAGIGVVLTDLQFKISIYNPALQKILGYTQEELQGLDLLQLAYPQDTGAPQQLQERLFSSEQELFNEEKRFLHKNGEIIWANLTVSLVRDTTQVPRFIITMVEDITEQKKLQAELDEVKLLSIKSNEAERLRIAQDLHDEPLQYLYGLIFLLSDLKDMIQTPEGQQIMTTYKQTLNRAINSLRAICGELRPPSLTHFGLDGAIRDHAERFQAQYPSIKIKLDLMFDYQILSESVRLSLFRIYQQSMINVVRHADATQINVRFYWDYEQIVLEIQDNGKGFVVPRHWIDSVRKGHMGLIGAAERIEMLRGRLEIISEPGNGTTIRAIAPRDPELQTEG
jgi:PAS domain S-box-containing protein